MSSKRLPSGTVSRSSQGERVRPPSDEAATGESSSGATSADELARENRRLARENRRLREQLDVERNERQAIIDRYEGLVDGCDASHQSGSSSEPASESESASESRSPRYETVGASASRSSLLDRLARLVGLR